MTLLSRSMAHERPPMAGLRSSEGQKVRLTPSQRPGGRRPGKTHPAGAIFSAAGQRPIWLEAATSITDS